MILTERPLAKPAKRTYPAEIPVLDRVHFSGGFMLVNDHPISLASTVACLLDALCGTLFCVASVLKLLGDDAAAFVVCLAFIGALGVATVAHVRIYVCHQNQLLRLILAAQRGGADEGLRVI